MLNRFVLAAGAVAALAAVPFLSGSLVRAETAKATAEDVKASTEIGRPGDIVLGEADAPVTFIEYASMTCPHCAYFKLMVFPQLKEAFIDTGLARYAFREFSTPPVVLSDTAFMLARCVPEDRYYQVINVLFRTQRQWTNVNTMNEARDKLKALARQMGINSAEFDTCLQDERELKRIRAVQEQASEELNVTGTPSLFINGEKYTGPLTIEGVTEALSGILSEEQLATAREAIAASEEEVEVVE